MPVNLDVLLRFHTIDKCLQNRYRKWTLRDLMEACSETLQKNVSKRSVQNDIQKMRSGDLGYYAPIVCKNGLYSYEDPSYSIKNASLTEADIQSIAIASKILGQYKGFELHSELKEIANKLESKAQRDRFLQIENIIDFEQAEKITGKEYLQPILQAIQNKEVLCIAYKRFDASQTNTHIVHPYLLKEYKSRWYLLGLNHKHQLITTYALDRMISLKEDYHYDYIENATFDPKVYFKNTIGITYTGELPVQLTLFVEKAFVPYLLSQPLHSTQKLLEETERGAYFQLEVVNNPELKTLILGYSDAMSIVAPAELKKDFIDKLKQAKNRYEGV
ncbi:helix-turn-helix transcriptional regulator [Olivibacter sitiensis]|uniref:helix-turn-helix transcriptional regulator n=1 Tax=Olivibacter sitiensis TaxID=376470 RepID=UPI000483F165|nr:WYL domain-containing protein [Olivibacter sitiensis]